MLHRVLISYIYLHCGFFPAAVRAVFSAPVQEAATSSVCTIEEHRKRGVPQSRVRMGLLHCFTVIKEPRLAQYASLHACIPHWLHLK